MILPRLGNAVPNTELLQPWLQDLGSIVDVQDPKPGFSFRSYPAADRLSHFALRSRLPVLRLHEAAIDQGKHPQPARLVLPKSSSPKLGPILFDGLERIDRQSGYILEHSLLEKPQRHPRRVVRPEIRRERPLPTGRRRVKQRRAGVTQAVQLPHDGKES
jgi:hypothetical protein